MVHKNYGRKIILLLQAITGCDTTSTFFYKGKLNILKLFEKRLDLNGLAALFKSNNCSRNLFLNIESNLFLLCMVPQNKNYPLIIIGIILFKLIRNNKPVNYHLSYLQLVPPNSIYFNFIIKY